MGYIPDTLYLWITLIALLLAKPTYVHTYGPAGLEQQNAPAFLGMQKYRLVPMTQRRLLRQKRIPFPSMKRSTRQEYASGLSELDGPYLRCLVVTNIRLTSLT